MHRFLRHALLLALAALALPVLGCNPSWLTVEIPDFASKQIKGVWIWRLDPETHQYERDTLVRFEGVTWVSTRPILSYFTYAQQGGISLTAGVERDHANPDHVTLTLGFERGAPGVFKVSTWNAVGDSPLSSESRSL